MPYASNGDVQIYYETFGDGSDDALLLINGLGSQCINYRVEWCEKFVAEGFFVIRFDNRDVGLSSHFSHVEPDVRGAMRAVAALGSSWRSRNRADVTITVPCSPRFRTLVR